MPTIHSKFLLTSLFLQKSLFLRASPIRFQLRGVADRNVISTPTLHTGLPALHAHEVTKRRFSRNR